MAEKADIHNKLAAKYEEKVADYESKITYADFEDAFKLLTETESETSSDKSVMGDSLLRHHTIQLQNARFKKVDEPKVNYDKQPQEMVVKKVEEPKVESEESIINGSPSFSDVEYAAF
jgi:hypothetical protein